MKLRDLYDRGLKLRQAMYGKDMVESRMSASENSANLCKTSSILTRTEIFGADPRCR